MAGLIARFGALSGNARGAVIMLFAALTFMLNAVLIKTLFLRGMDPMQIAFFRSFIGLLVTLPLVWRAGIVSSLTSQSWGLHWLRGLCIGLSMLTGFYAIAALPLAEVTALTFTQPLFTVVLAVFVLGEIVGWRRGAAVVVGFLGVVIMARPGAAAFDAAAPIALASAFFIALASILVKRLPRGEMQSTMLLTTGVALVPITLLPALFVWRTPDATDLLLLSLLAILGVLGQGAINLAFRDGEASFLAPLDYTRMIFAIVFGYVFFAELPDLWTLAGAAVIMGATIYILRRERQAASLRRPGILPRMPPS